MKKIFCALVVMGSLFGSVSLDALFNNIGFGSNSCNPCNPCDTYCDDACDPCQPDCCNSWFDFSTFSVEARYSAFFPLSSRARDIYKDALPCLELQGNINVTDNIIGFLSAGYIWSSGRSIGLGDKTELSLIPVVLGGKYLWCISDSLEAYLGAGVAYTWLRTHDHSDFVRKHTHKGTFGGVAQAGFYYHLCNNVFFEGFVDYIYQRFHFGDRNEGNRFVEGVNVNLSGLKVGVGVGTSF